MCVWVLGTGDSLQAHCVFFGRRVGFVSLRKNAPTPPPPTVFIGMKGRTVLWMGTQQVAACCLLCMRKAHCDLILCDNPRRVGVRGECGGCFMSMCKTTLLRNK